MKSISTLAGLLALAALGACSDNKASDQPPADTASGDTVVVPAATETTTIVREVDGQNQSNTNDRVTIGADGVTADVGDRDTRVTADVDGNPSLTVEKK